jgi:hypothetical protein
VEGVLGPVSYVVLALLAVGLVVLVVRRSRSVASRPRRRGEEGSARNSGASRGTRP